MSRALIDLEAALAGLISEHRKLLEQVKAHEAAIHTFNFQAMDKAITQQEASKLRIMRLEAARRLATEQLTRTLKLDPNITLTRIADLHPARRQMLLNMRADLKALAQQIADRNKVAGRVAAAVLGHLSTAVRLLAGVAGKA